MKIAWNWKLALGCGLAMGFALWSSPGTLFIALCVFVLICLCIVYLPHEEQRFVILLIVISMVTRYLLIVAISYDELAATSSGGAYIGGGDQRWITLWGRLFAEYAQGERPPLYNGVSIWEFIKIGKLEGKEEVGALLYPGQYGYSMNMNLLGIFYSMFGYSPVASKGLNALVATCTGLIIYNLGRQYFGTSVGRCAACLALFWPSMYAWSITNLKDSFRAFVICAILYSYVRLSHSLRVRYVIVLAVLSLVLGKILRPELAWVILLSLVVAFSMQVGVRWRTKFVIGILILAVCLGLSPIRAKFSQKAVVAKNLMWRYHLGVISTGGQTYKIYRGSRYYSYANTNMNIPTRDFAFAIGKGWWHFILEPFVWPARTGRSKVAIPLMVVWYALLPFAGLSLLSSIRHRYTGIWVFPSFLILFITVLALTGGNIGTVFRHRDMVAPVILLFAAAGIVQVVHLLSEWRPGRKMQEGWE